MSRFSDPHIGHRSSSCSCLAFRGPGTIKNEIKEGSDIFSGKGANELVIFFLQNRVRFGVIYEQTKKIITYNEHLNIGLVQNLRG